MLEFFLLCSLYAWDRPAFGTPDYYEIYVDGRRYPEISYTDSHEICVYDDNAHIVQVIAVDLEGNRSDISDPSTPWRMESTEYRVAVSNLIRADFDGDGVVGLGDWSIFQQLFGCTHLFGEELHCD